MKIKRARKAMMQRDKKRGRDESRPYIGYPRRWTVVLLKTWISIQGTHRPASPVSEIPLMICFCSSRKATVTGMAAKAAAAIIGPYSAL